MRSCATGERSNMEIRTVELKNNIIQAKLFPVAIFPVESFVIAFPLQTVLTILSFALLNSSHTVPRRNCVSRAVHHTQFLCGKCLRQVV